MNRPGSAARNFAGTDARLGTAARRGGATALETQVHIEDRPMTQRGLGGMRVTQGSFRQVEDRPYWLGVLRTKINDLTSEINRLHREMNTIEEDSGSYLTYEKTYERMNAEIRDLQGELSDYNTLLEKATSSDGFASTETESEQLRRENERLEKDLDILFEQKQRREQALRVIETKLREVKQFEQLAVDKMDGGMRSRFTKAKQANEILLAQITQLQKQMDETNQKIEGLSREIRTQPFKNEALLLYEQLYEQETKRAQLEAELKQFRSPKEEKEQLLAQIKTDNQQIALIEKQISELEQQINVLQDENRALQEESDESAQLERRQRFDEMRRKEEQIDEFLKTFDNNRKLEKEKLVRLQSETVSALEDISRSLKVLEQAGVTATSTGATSVQLPSQEEYEQLKEMLKFKGEELKKSEKTGQSLLKERTRKQEELQKVELLEGNMKREIQELKDKIDQFRKDLDKYRNVERAVQEYKEKREQLTMQQKVILNQSDMFKHLVRELSSVHEAQKAQLLENETYTQLLNLERKLTHLEQNNYSIKEYIESRSAETDFEPIKERCINVLMQQYNKLLQDASAGGKRI